jgi:hypothetical protein
MLYRNCENVRVWECCVSEEGDVDWKQNVTTARVGTTDEYYFWRVINNTGKHFFISPEQWMEFSGHNGEGLEDVMKSWHDRYTNLAKTE